MSQIIFRCQNIYVYHFRWTCLYWKGDQILLDLPNPKPLTLMIANNFFRSYELNLKHDVKFFLRKTLRIFKTEKLKTLEGIAN